MIGVAGRGARWLKTATSARKAGSASRVAKRASINARVKANTAEHRMASASPKVKQEANVGAYKARHNANQTARERARAKARAQDARKASKTARKDFVGGAPGKLLLGGAMGTAAIAGVAGETFNPDGYAGDVLEDMTGSRDFAGQMAGNSLRNQFTANRYRIGSPPGDVVFGMYNLR